VSDNEALRFKDAALIDVLTHYIAEPDALRRGEDQQRAMLKSARYRLIHLELELRRLQVEAARPAKLYETADLRDPPEIRALCDALWPRP
jgi:hypothetical protein